MFKFERELVETKDILKTFMIKYDLFATETNNRFTDFEYALSDLEKTIQPSEPVDANELTADGEETQGTSINDIDTNNESVGSIMSVDLKNIIKQELASGN